MALKIEIVFKASARMKISRSLKLITDHKAELLFNYRTNTNEKKLLKLFLIYCYEILQVIAQNIPGLQLKIIRP